MRQRFIPLTGAALLLTLAAGCGKSDGPPLGSVTGTVTIDGKLVPNARITFIPKEKGSPSYGATDASGNYRLAFTRDRTGALIGVHSVCIENAEREIGDHGVVPAAAQTIVIPASYRSPGALSADVKAGRNTFNFELQSTVNRTVGSVSAPAGRRG